MNERQQKIAIGCLLHDFGKLLYRYNDGRNHSVSGYEYLKTIYEIESEILECVKYHHGKLLKNANVKENAICYITYIADNIAAATDRREKEESDGTGGFIRNVSFESVFNILNGNNQRFQYKPQVLSESIEINYPVNEEIEFNEDFYSRIVNNLSDSIKGIMFSDEYINSLLQLLESNLIYVPSSTQTKELRDISLYDHLKLTAALGLCIEHYMVEKDIRDYKTELFKNSVQFYEKKVFRVYSLDLSGIQCFIYNISSKGALKRLRARSFYLEILMENVVDELLTRIGLFRANVLYTGGGHTYMLLPATEKVAGIIEAFEKELNTWLIDEFGTELYMAGGFCDCSANDLMNIPEGSYKKIFENISKKISETKLNRYLPTDIVKLNSATKKQDHTRECVICHRSDRLNSDNECSVCNSLKNLSNMIIGRTDMFFSVMNGNDTSSGISLPFNQTLTAFSWDKLVQILKTDERHIRTYSKNKPCTGYNIASNLWVADYCAEKDFSMLVKNSEGIKRLAVIRGDVDNLGQAFVEGFEKTNNGKYETITRTAVFSRKLSEFFKLHINQILRNGQFQLFNDKQGKSRNATIVYSGGDDFFIVGGWDDIICFAIDLYFSLKEFSQGMLTFSAGIGIYPEKYPISSMARHAGELESASKEYNNKEKNAVTLFDELSTYSWQDFIECVIGEKLRLLQKYIKSNNTHNKAMLYKMLDLIRSGENEEDDRLNIARFAYLLARLKPNPKNVKIDEMEEYNKFSKKMFRWVQNEEDKRQLITAIYVYIYMTREREEEADEAIK